MRWHPELIAVRIRPPSREVIEAFRDWVAGFEETVGVFVTSGLEDFIIHVAVRDNQDFYAFVIDELTQRREVADVRTSVVYEHLLPRAPRRDQPLLPRTAAARGDDCAPRRARPRRSTA